LKGGEEGPVCVVSQSNLPLPASALASESIFTGTLKLAQTGKQKAAIFGNFAIAIAGCEITENDADVNRSVERSLGIATRRISMSGARRLFC
jgi:hypothetical protein